MSIAVEGFPHVSIASLAGGLPIEVTLIAQLGHGAGSAVSVGAAERQRRHSGFVDELDEPSVKIGGTHLDHGDSSALYSFMVGANGHPFHRHQGNRVFTAISGSSGAQLRFSTASDVQIAADPANFVRALRYVNIPADCLFTVRFGGGTWHQFVPLEINTDHPALFAVSCHTNELGGQLTPPVLEHVLNNSATIATLTELLPPAVEALLPLVKDVPTTELSLGATHGSVMALLCQKFRSRLGALRIALTRWAPRRGFAQQLDLHFPVREEKTSPLDSLLQTQFAGGAVHEDYFSLILPAHLVGGRTAQSLLAHVLDGFVQRPSKVVSALMSFRNALVKPWGLRRSHLGCPVSSLVAQNPSSQYFDGRYPVLAQSHSDSEKYVQVLLGADDKHLQFRSCVAVRLLPEGDACISLGSKVRCTNQFGRVYMALINLVHRKYVSPTMLRTATQAAIGVLGAQNTNMQLPPVWTGAGHY